MGSSRIKIIIFLQTLLYTSAIFCMAGETVSFRHKTAKPVRFKLDCREKQGKHDAFTTYTCYDKEGNAEPFYPGNEWVEVTVEKVCLRHKLRDNIRECIKIHGKHDKIEHYGCVDAKGKLNIFALDPNNWEKLNAEDPDCKPHLIEMDIPRGAFDLNGEKPDRRESGEPSK